MLLLRVVLFSDFTLLKCTKGGYILVVITYLWRAKNGSVQFVFSGGNICASLAPYATDNFISACPVEFLVSFVRYVCLKYLPSWASKSNNIFPYPL